MLALVILFYVLGAFPTYCFLDETTNQKLFNKIWFTVFWPALAVVCLVSIIKKLKR